MVNASIGTMVIVAFKNYADFHMKKFPNVILMADAEEMIAAFSILSPKLKVQLLLYTGGASGTTPSKVKGETWEEAKESEDKKRKW